MLGWAEGRRILFWVVARPGYRFVELLLLGCGRGTPPRWRDVPLCGACTLDIGEGQFHIAIIVDTDDLHRGMSLLMQNFMTEAGF